ncbi:MAG: YceI family protein [Balneolaceae bacterium]|nr:YceI family protein [Balneolaceae bacterium]
MTTQKIISLLAVLLLTAGVSIGQDVQLNIQDSPNMHLYGEANIKSWDAAINQVDGTLTLQNIENLTAESLTADAFQNLSLTIPVEKIEAESDGLTKNLHKYLKEDDYPNITFELNNVTDITEQQDGSLLVTASGVITAAGTENPVDMQVTANLIDDGIQFTGKKELLMTDFGIDPPTAVFGTIRSRDEIRIEFDVSFSK